MSEYVKQIVKAKKALTDTERKVLAEAGNLPVLCKANTTLPPLQEVIVKAIYLAGGMFLSDLKKLVIFQSDLQKTERSIQSLVRDGYLSAKEVPPFGNLYGLTADGIKQIRFHPAYATGEAGNIAGGMKLDVEGALMKRKLVSALVAEYVFMTQTEELLKQFFTTDKLTRNYYLMKQYLKNIVYREFLLLSQTEKETALKKYGADESEISILCTSSSYTKRNVELFAEILFREQGFDTLKASDDYHAYIAYIRKECLTTPSEGTFYLLKEMQTEARNDYRALELLTDWNCNVLRHGMESVWKALSAELTGNPLLQREQALETCNQYIKFLGDERRSLIQGSAYKKKEDELLLKEITEHLALLDNTLTRLREKKEVLETDFTFPTLSNYDEDGNCFEERVLTFKRLEQNAIYIEMTEAEKLTFYVVQTQEDYFDLFSLHKKTTMLWQMCRRLFPLYQAHIKVITATEEQKRFIEGKFSSLEKKLLASRETAFLGNSLPGVLEVMAVQGRMTERYQFFHQMITALKGETEDDTETDSREE